MKFIEFGSLTTPGIILYPILFTISSCISKLVFERQIASRGIKVNSILLSYFQYISEILNGFFLIGTTIKSKRDTTEDEAKLRLKDREIALTNTISYHYKNQGELKWRICLIIILPALIDGLTQLFLKHFTQSNNTNPQYKNQRLFFAYQMKSFQIIVCGLLCFFVFKYQINRHHILSIFLILLGVVLFSIKPSDSINDLIILISEYFATYIFRAIKSVHEKYIMDIQFTSPYMLLLLEGCYGVLMLSLFLPLFIFITPLDLFFSKVTIYESLKAIGSDYIVILLLIGDMVCNMGENLFKVLIAKISSPTSRAVVDTFASFLILAFEVRILDQVNDGSVSVVVLESVGFVLIIIGVVIYYEIVRVYCCDLAHNTAFEVNHRCSLYDQRQSLVEITELNEMDDNGGVRLEQ